VVEQIIDLHYSHGMLGVLPIEEELYIFISNNEFMLRSAIIPRSQLVKHWNALLHHRACEAIAANLLVFKHLARNQNLSNLFTKNMSLPELLPLTG